jgi:hypothetical protein
MYFFNCEVVGQTFDIISTDFRRTLRDDGPLGNKRPVTTATCSRCRDQCQYSLCAITFGLSDSYARFLVWLLTTRSALLQPAFVSRVSELASNQDDSTTQANRTPHLAGLQYRHTGIMIDPHGQGFDTRWDTYYMVALARLNGINVHYFQTNKQLQD